MTLQLYWSPDSANLVIRIALETLEQPFQPVRINRGKAEHKSDEFLKLNPQGLLPVLTDGDLVVFETGAILWHLIERAGKFGANGPDAADPAARAAALKWMFFISNTVHADLRLAFYTHRYVDDPSAVPAVLNGLAHRFAEHLDLIAREMSGDGVLGSELTVPDIYLTVCMRWAQIYPTHGRLIDGLERWPRLLSLARRIEETDAARRAFDAESIALKGALSAPQRPALSSDEVTGSI